MYTSRSAAASQCFQMAVVFLTQSFPNLSSKFHYFSIAACDFENSERKSERAGGREGYIERCTKR